MKNIILAVCMLLLILPTVGLAQIPGDLNCNGVLDIADLIHLINMMSFYLAPLEDTTGCVWYAGDANYDSLYHTIADWIQIQHLFAGDTLPDNHPQPNYLDSIIIGDAGGAPGEVISLPLTVKSVEDLSGLFIQARIDTTYLKNPWLTVGADSLLIYDYVDGGKIFLDHWEPLDSGYYHVANLNVWIWENAPPDTELTVELVAGDYYPSGFGNISNPTYFIRPILVHGAVHVRSTGVDEGYMSREMAFSLINFPNPFNSSTIIQFTLESESYVKLSIYDLLGRVADVPFNGFAEAGHHEITWDGGDRPSGIYFYRLVTSEDTYTRRMTLLK